MSRMLFTLRLLSLSKAQAHFTSLIQPISAIHGCTSAQINGILRNHVELSKSRKILQKFRTLCSTTDLAAKKCVSCNSKDIRPMGKAQADELIIKVPGWNLIIEEGMLKLSRSWTVKSFSKGLEFFQIVANVAEAEGHHPDLHLVGWNNVTIEIWTHSVRGLTENDFILAAKINGLDVANLLRIKPSK